MYFEEGMLAGLCGVRHVASGRGVVDELWGRRQDGIWVKRAQGRMEGGGEGVLVWRRRGRVSSCEYIRHGEKKQKRGRRRGAVCATQME